MRGICTASVFSLPFVCLGTARYVIHEGSKPMSIVWGLDAEISA